MKLNLVAAPSNNFGERKDIVQFIIIHATGTKNLQETLDVLEKRCVSAHYVIDKDGTIYGLVDPDKRAWHAGISDWNGYCAKTGLKGLNDASIGIELQSAAKGRLANEEVCKFDNFSNEQIMSCIELCKRLMRAYNIKLGHVLRHSDIAPNRKFDPGETFPWEIFKQMLAKSISPKSSKLINKQKSE